MNVIEKKVKKIIEKVPLLTPIVDRIAASGGRALIVGGAVRDLLLGLPVKDIDIEVHHISLEQLEQILRQFGAVDLVGKVYGVLRVHPLNIDWSVPRTDKPGRKPQVHIDPYMTFRDAFARRDLTINAMGIDIITGELIDPFNGQSDLMHNILRSPDIDRFVEDPLRFYRVMQFIGRFNMYPDEELNLVCSRMDVSGVSRERIEAEMEKLLLKSSAPSRAFWWLKDIGRLPLFPEIAATIGISQDPLWHPEGDVFVHTMQALDAAATLAYDSDLHKLMVVYGALCHDLGKVTTTIQVDGRIKSWGHDAESVKVAATLLRRITRNTVLIAGVKKLIKYHMVPTQLIKPEVKLSAIKRLANKLAPEVTIALLAQLCLADKLARNPNGRTPLDTPMDNEIDLFLERAQEAEVADQVEKPVLLGRDLLDVIKPGPELGALLAKAYHIQIEEGITDKDVLKKRVLSS